MSSRTGFESSALSRLFRLENPIRDYPWGSRDLLPQLMGRKPDGRPQAEMWIGGHPASPSSVELEGRAITLDQLVADHPEEVLGAPRLRREKNPSSEGSKTATRFPFLLKILAAAEPLSIQTHPSAEQARQGFERENREGLSFDDPRRSYRDPFLKDEMVCAFSGEFPVLSGLRPRDQSIELLRSVGSPEQFEPWVTRLATGHPAEGYRYFLGELLGAVKTPLEDRATLARLRSSERPSHRWTARLADRFPGDPMALAPLFLNLIHLSPGQALVTEAGALHSYLGGIAIELMTPSDNVLRGGLTSKHVDRPELLRILRFESDVQPILEPKAVRGRSRFATEGLELALDHIELGEGEMQTLGETESVEVVLVIAGRVVADIAGESTDPIELSPGDALLAPAAAGRYRLRAVTDSGSNSAQVFRASCS